MRIFELSSNFPLKRRKEKKGKNDQTRADFRIFEKKKKKEKRSIISRIIANSQTRPNTFPFPKKIKTKEETSTILSYPPQHSDPRIQHERKQARSLLETQISRKRSSLPRGWRRRDGWKRNAGWK